MAKKTEISVREAARQINCTERTIINFIKMKRFEALKVGRDWFIDYASFVSFAKRYDYALLDEEETSADDLRPPNSSIERNPEKDLEKYPVAKKRHGNIETLRVYQMFKDIFEKGRFKAESSHPCELRITNLGAGVLEEIGAGFYAFGAHMKRLHYINARARLGAIIALLHSDENLRKRWQEEIEQIEERLLPAFGALIKKLEQKSYRNQNGELA
ncbi:helix-turn-helix domain-containing protein [Bdellovibrio sp.]|uniref:helix-turn-helix domain-containing protein n=1 Tax=Bdellovibrio sp. TaxID=28201 RepID=UPI0039E27025